MSNNRNSWYFISIFAQVKPSFFTQFNEKGKEA
ncbi:predicted protein [Sclerotinia sclerotiorum 1980 UF-70]|uniref:Uncharacterized protein n=1 Tax=Sclerotinia sclerotiorum (strain ATCC 18683 / 1980 / Ss-1) TaxID=665079 RepID=A7F0R1_SCLS1|nr:predicted protein [Sclerotinia sclerotiorum 1980 UF-70]EDN95303.1 predicted protein [Sclerotinia sclerotiorum 1980 UF-70]